VAEVEFPLGGYAGKELRVNLTKGKIVDRPMDPGECKRFVGGRGLDAKTLFDELAPSVDALSPGNMLCLSTGPITGLLGPTTGRVNIAARSPLTNIYGNSNAGTNWGPELKYAGYDRVVITGRSKKPVYLYIEDGKAELLDASRLWGEGVLKATDRIQESHRGYDTKVSAVGPGAENGALFGSVIFDHWDAAGRCGLGTVMASKKLKAIAVTGNGRLEVPDPERYMEIVRDGWDAIVEDPGFRSGQHSSLGTMICVLWGNTLGWLPTRNFREATFEGAEGISGERFRDEINTRPSPIPGGRACMSCPNRCKRYGLIKSGPYAGTKGGIEFEGVAAFGSKCGVDDLEAVFHAFMLSNDYGLDCVSAGNTIAFLMELYEEGIIGKKDTGGLELKFGNAEAMVEMVHRTKDQKGKIGKLAAMGSERAARKIGKGSEKYLTNVKGQETIACDPRAAKGFGFTYAISSRGSDHLRAHPVFEMIKKMPDPVAKDLFGSAESHHLTKYGGKVKMVVWHEDISAITDSMGSCRFMHASYYCQYPVPETEAKYGGRRSKSGIIHSIKYHDWLTAATGIEFSYDDILRIGNRIINLERAINVRYGIRRKDDTLPRRFMKEKIPTGRTKGEVFDKKHLDSMVDQYYRSRGWDLKSGLPVKNKLVEMGLEDVAKELAAKKLVAGEKKRR
jgi:aldehyde:ferredoxin oxidoreductase